MMYYIVLYDVSYKRTQRIYLLADNFDLLVEKIFFYQYDVMNLCYLKIV